MSTPQEPDCGSSSCMFSSKGGMRTNGPCRCMENAGFHGSAVMAAKQMLREVLLLRARLDAMPHDRTWTKDKPTPGEWWLSVAPDKRNPRLGVQWPPVLRCLIVDAGNLLCAQFGRALFRLDLDIFVGAQWKLVDPDPADPFADKRPSSSCDASEGSTNV